MPREGVPTLAVQAWSSQIATVLWSRAALRLAGLFCPWSGVSSVMQDCGTLGLPRSHGSPASPGRAVCLVLGTSLCLVTVNVSKVRLGDQSRYCLCFLAVSTDLTGMGLDSQAFFHA